MGSSPLRDRRILVVEDEYLIAMSLADALENAGSVVVGPAPSVDKAIQTINSEPRIDAAVVDVNLGGVLAYAVADLLIARKIPFVFTSGYEDNVLRDRYSQVKNYPRPFICSGRWRKRWLRPCRSHDHRFAQKDRLATQQVVGRAGVVSVPPRCWRRCAKSGNWELYATVPIASLLRDLRCRFELRITPSSETVRQRLWSGATARSIGCACLVSTAARVFPRFSAARSTGGG